LVKKKRAEHEVYKKIVINELEAAKKSKTVMCSKIKNFGNKNYTFYKLKKFEEHQYYSGNYNNTQRIQVCSQHKDKVFYDAQKGGNFESMRDGKHFVKDICNENCVELDQELWEKTVQSRIDSIKAHDNFQSYLQYNYANEKEAAIQYLRFQTGDLYIDWNDEKK